MTWNELIARLNEIPEYRREEKAVFCLGEEEPNDNWQIDNMERIDLNEGGI